MSNFKFQISNFKLDKGFTLIELIIVFVVISLLSTISIQLFVDYNGKQTLNSATKSLVTALQTARSRALSQVKPTYSTRCDNEVLQGYNIDIDRTPPPGKLDIYAICGDDIITWWASGSAKITTINFPQGINLNYSHHNDEYLFKVLTGGVEINGDGDDGDVDGNGSENVCVRYKGRNNTITVYTDGRIIVIPGVDYC